MDKFSKNKKILIVFLVFLLVGIIVIGALLATGAIGGSGSGGGDTGGGNQSIMSIISESVIKYWNSLYDADGGNIYIRINSDNTGKESIWMSKNSNNSKWTLKSIPTTITQLYTPNVGTNGWQNIDTFWNPECSATAPIIDGATDRCLKTDIYTYGIKDIQVNPNGSAISYNYNGIFAAKSNSDGVLTIPPDKSTLSADRESTNLTWG